jgi:GntR family transcriptional repressor for pyruvate dehydrogenase complex
LNMSNLYGTIPHSTLVADVAKALRGMILEGKIKAGEFLPPQKELATEFGVGLSTIREAIQVLTAIGLVRSHPGKGTWVNENAFGTLIDPMEVSNRLGELRARQVYEARSVIEVALTKLAAERASPEDVRRIWNALKAMESFNTEDEFVEADLEFHLAVASAAHNELLEQFYHLIRSILSQVITEMVMLPEVKEKSIQLQRSIAQAIKKSDVSEAEKAALKHMNYIESLLTAYE